MAVSLKFSGLFTSGNTFSSAPDGSFEVADNVVLRNDNIVEPMRGYLASAANPSGAMTRIFPANGNLYCFAANGDLRTYTAGAGWGAAFTDSTVSNHFLPVDSTNPIRMASSGKSQFFTTINGVKCSDSPTTGTVALAGLAAVPFLTSSTGTSGATYLLPGASAAYYVVLAYYDSNNNLVQSAPSARFTVTNPFTTQTTLSVISLGAVGVLSGGTFPGDVFPCVEASLLSPHGLAVGQSINVSAPDARDVTHGFLSGGFTVTTVPAANQFTYQGYNGTSNGSGNYGTIYITPTGAVNVTISAQLPVAGASRATFAQLYRSQTAAPGVTPQDECFLVAEHVITASERTAGTITFAADGTADSFLTVPLYTNAFTGGGIASANDTPPLARDLCAYNNRLLYANTQEHHGVPLSLIGTSGLVSGTSTLVINGVTYKAAASENAAASPPQFQLYASGTASQNIDNTARSLCSVITKYNYTNAGTLVAEYLSTASDAPGQMLIREAGVGGSSFTLNAGQDGQTCWSPDLSKAAYVQTSDNNRRPNRIWYSNDGEPWGVPADNWIDVGAADQAILRVILVRSTVFVFKADSLWTIQGDDPANYDVRPLDPGLVLMAPESACVVGNQIFCYTNRGAVYVSESGVSPAISSPIERDFLYIQNNYSQYPSTAFGVSYEGETLWLLALPNGPSDTGCSQQYVFNAAPIGWTRWLVPNAVHGCYDPTSQSLTWAVGSNLYIERKTVTSSDFQWPDGSAITCVLRLTPISGGDPHTQKQFRTAVFSFKYADFNSCTVQFSSDAAWMGTPATKTGPGPSGFGTLLYGLTPWGITGRGFVLRTDMPQAVGLSCTLSTQLIISQAQAYWQLQGLSIAYDTATEIPRRG